MDKNSDLYRCSNFVVDDFRLFDFRQVFVSWDLNQEIQPSGAVARFENLTNVIQAGSVDSSHCEAFKFHGEAFKFLDTAARYSLYGGSKS